MTEAVLAVWLVAVLPAYMCWKSLRPRRPDRSRTTRYLSTIGLVAVSVAALAAIWIAQGRSGADLGLAIPPPLAGMIGLLIAALIIPVLIVMMRAKARTDRPPSDAMNALLPETGSEAFLFVVFSVVAGFGWEVLYRGFLLWFLQPFVTLWGAVLLAAIAYGLAHGIADKRRIGPSLLSALVFTAAYALTHSLWWLIVIHIGGLCRAAIVRDPAGVDDRYAPCLTRH